MLERCAVTKEKYKRIADANSSAISIATDSVFRIVFQLTTQGRFVKYIDVLTDTTLDHADGGYVYWTHPNTGQCYRFKTVVRDGNVYVAPLWQIVGKIPYQWRVIEAELMTWSDSRLLTAVKENPQYWEKTYEGEFRRAYLRHKRSKVDNKEEALHHLASEYRNSLVMLDKKLTQLYPRQILGRLQHVVNAIAVVRTTITSIKNNLRCSTC